MLAFVGGEVRRAAPVRRGAVPGGEVKGGGVEGGVVESGAQNGASSGAQNGASSGSGMFCNGWYGKEAGQYCIVVSGGCRY